MDLKWCNEFWSGCIVTINIKFHKGICKDECGLATSSRKVAAKLWNGAVPKWLDPLKAAQLLWGAENFDAGGTEARPYWAGSQDHCGIASLQLKRNCWWTIGQIIKKRAQNRVEEYDSSMIANLV